jgi:YhcH/YjgK/YiaL family protein
MILDRLEHAGIYASMGPAIKAGLDYLASTCFDDAPDGRVAIDGDRIFALVQHYTAKPLEKGRWEAHRRYLDIQYVAAGAERFGVGELEAMRIVEDLPAKDLLFLDDAEAVGQFVTLSAGTFAVVWPHEAHMPGLQAGPSPAAVTKVVVKVLVE